MRILFIGGNGTISAFASRLAVERGHDLTLLNRGTSSRRAPIQGAESLVGDAEDVGSVRAAIGSREFDVVVNWRSFHPSQVESDIDLFIGYKFRDLFGISILHPSCSSNNHLIIYRSNSFSLTHGLFLIL